MVKRRRNRNNRKVSSGTRGAIARVSTGIPISRKVVSADPPMLPHVLAYPVRIRFNVVATHSNTITGYSVQLAGTPISSNTIRLWYNAATPGSYPTQVFGLTAAQIFVAAAMRVYGVDVTVDTTGANYVTTEYAVQKVTAYGPENRARPSSSITLSLDFGSDIPGFVGKDSASGMRRAVVSASPPRLSWQAITNSMNHMASLDIGTFEHVYEPNAPTTFNLAYPCGTLDFSVIVRRGAIVQTPLAATTVSVGECASAHSAQA